MKLSKPWLLRILYLRTSCTHIAFVSQTSSPLNKFVRQTFVLLRHIVDGHKVSSALRQEVIFGALFEFSRIFEPRYGRIVKGQLALEGGRVAFSDLGASDAFCELN